MKPKQRVQKAISILLLILIFAALFLGLIYKSLNGGIRGGDAFQDEPVAALIQENGDRNYTLLSYIEECDEKYCLGIFADEEENAFLLVVFEKRNDKYAYVYSYSFADEEITEQSGLIAYDIYKGYETVIGIMSADYGGISVNGTIRAQLIPFEHNGNKYYCWYASVNGGLEAIEKTEYIISVDNS